MRILILALLMLFECSCSEKVNDFYSLEKDKGYQFFFSDQGAIIKVIYDEEHNRADLLIFDANKKFIDRANITFAYHFEINSFSGNTIGINFNSFDTNQKKIISKFSSAELIKFNNKSSYSIIVMVKDFNGSAAIPERQIDSIEVDKKNNTFLLFNNNQLLNTVSRKSFFIDKNNVLEKSFDNNGILVTSDFILKDIILLLR